MAQIDIGFKREFDAIAGKTGYIGDPHGAPAYCYIRVSTEEQTKDGSTGLGRQIQNCNAVALQNNLKIPWELVFADGSSGLEFTNRVHLMELLTSIKNNKVASFVVIENIDRLSRHADWQQGYLLEKFEENSVKPVFFKSFGSRIERLFMGVMSQEEIEKFKERVKKGVAIKAQRGYVTSTKRAFGYDFCDEHGNVLEKPGKFPKYKIREDEAIVIRYIFEQIALNGMTANTLATKLTDLYAPPKNASYWESKLICEFIHNPVYKGAFARGRNRTIKRKNAVVNPNPGENQKFYSVMVEMPEELWTTVKVPEIVSPELWAMANRQLEINKLTSTRNAKNEYLLSGIMRCAECGFAVGGNISSAISGHKKPDTDASQVKRLWYKRYSCTSKEARLQFCSQRGHTINVDILDNLIWSVTVNTLLNPKIILDAIDSTYNHEDNLNLANQIEYVEKELAKVKTRFDKISEAYEAEEYDLEYMRERTAITKEIEAKLKTELKELMEKQILPEQIEEQKRIILKLSENAKRAGISMDAPFELKKRVIHSLIDKIIVNIDEKWVKIEGILKGTLQIPDKNGNTNNESGDNDFGLRGDGRENLGPAIGQGRGKNLQRRDR